MLKPAAIAISPNNENALFIPIGCPSKSGHIWEGVPFNLLAQEVSILWATPLSLIADTCTLNMDKSAERFGKIHPAPISW